MDLLFVAFGASIAPYSAATRILVLGAGGVGSAAVKILARRSFARYVAVADVDLARAERAVAAVGDDRFAAVRLDASDQAAIEAGTWSGAGVLGPEAFDAMPFLDLLAGAYGSPWSRQDRPT